jgi:hypothetical protein
VLEAVVVVLSMVAAQLTQYLLAGLAEAAVEDDGAALK